MKIAVCVNHVPDTAAKIKIAANPKEIDKNVPFIINPYDEFAVEEALKWKEKFNCQAIVISAGPDANKESIRKALAMGIDEGVLLQFDGYKDPFSVAHALSEEIKANDCNLVFFGKQSVDLDNSITGTLTAELLGYSSASTVVALEINDPQIKAEREIEGGKEVVTLSLPAVITCQKGLNEPRYASLKGIMAAKKKVIAEKPAVLPEENVELINFSLPAPKPNGRIIGSDASAAAELVKLLREEAKVI